MTTGTHVDPRNVNRVAKGVQSVTVGIVVGHDDWSLRPDSQRLARERAHAALNRAVGRLGVVMAGAITEQVMDNQGRGVQLVLTVPTHEVDAGGSAKTVKTLAT